MSSTVVIRQRNVEIMKSFIFNALWICVVHRQILSKDGIQWYWLFLERWAVVFTETCYEVTHMVEAFIEALSVKNALHNRDCWRWWEKLFSLVNCFFVLLSLHVQDGLGQESIVQWLVVLGNHAVDKQRRVIVKVKKKWYTHRIQGLTTWVWTCFNNNTWKWHVTCGSLCPIEESNTGIALSIKSLWCTSDRNKT
jgi:hypothetical protein